jgi:hypothetical protein
MQLLQSTKSVSYTTVCHTHLITIFINIYFCFTHLHIRAKHWVFVHPLVCSTVLSEQFLFYFNWVMLGCRQYKMMYVTWCVGGWAGWERNEALQNSNSTAIICYDIHIKRLLLCSLLFAFVYYVYRIIWQRQARNNVKWKHFSCCQ